MVGKADQKPRRLFLIIGDHVCNPATLHRNLSEASWQRASLVIPIRKTNSCEPPSSFYKTALRMLSKALRIQKHELEKKLNA